jgi:hypothetical protein
MRRKCCEKELASGNGHAERIVGYSESAGLNRHVVGNERVLQERRKRLHLGLESCGEHREVLVEA